MRLRSAHDVHLQKKYAFLRNPQTGTNLETSDPYLPAPKLFHILFNMYWTFELGRMVESRKVVFS